MIKIKTLLLAVITFIAFLAVSCDTGGGVGTKKLLNIVKVSIGGGEGTVNSTSGGIACGSTCSADIDTGTVVVLSAIADIGSSFTGWDGDCSGTAVTCEVKMEEAKNVKAIFTKIATAKHRLRVIKLGTGSGTVSSLTAGIDCGTDCSEDIVAGTSIVITARADAGSRFSAWDGDCAGVVGATCSLVMDRAKTVKAIFTKVSATTHFLSINKIGSGDGLVKSEPAGIICGANCDAQFEESSRVELTANPNNDSKFVSWSGDCVGSSLSCVVTMSAAKNVTARFELKSTTACADPVNIPDINLKRVIKAQLGLTRDLSCDDLLALTILDSQHTAATANALKIINLEGLQHAINLKKLKLGYNKIANLSKLSGLDQLETLLLLNNSISNLSALSSLANLAVLNLNENHIINLTPLSGLSNLNSLQFDQNQVVNISALSSLTKLKKLTMSQNQVVDISAVSGLTELYEMRADSNQIALVNPLKDLLKLNILSLAENDVVGIKSLYKLKHLRILNLHKNKIVNSDVVQNFVNIWNFDISNNKINRLDFLVNNSGVGSGDRVNVSHNCIDDGPSGQRNNILTLQGRGVNLIYLPQDTPCP